MKLKHSSELQSLVFFSLLAFVVCNYLELCVKHALFYKLLVQIGVCLGYSFLLFLWLSA